jgi:hypothetical protein
MVMKVRFVGAALLGMLAATPACRVGPKIDPSVDGVAYAPDGTLLAFTNAGIYLFDAQLAVERGRIPLEAPPAFEGLNQYHYSLSADGTVAAVAFTSPASDLAPVVLDLHRVATGKVVNRFEIATPPAGGISATLIDVALSPTGNLIAATPVIGADGHLLVIDAVTGAARTAARGQKTLPVWSRDGSTLYVVGHTTMGAVLEAYDAGAGLKWAQQLVGDVTRLDATADGATLAGVVREDPCTSACLSRYSLWSAADGSVISQQALPAGSSPVGWPVGGVGDGEVFTCSATDVVCAIQLEDDSGATRTNSIRVYRSDGTDVATVPLGDPVSAIALSPDGQLLAMSSPTRVSVYRIADGAVVGERSFAHNP